MQHSDRIMLQTQFGDMTEHLQNDLIKLANEKIENLSGSYFKSILKKEGAEIRIHLQMSKNSDGLYEGKVQFRLDNDDYIYHNDKPFKEPYDIVSHAFKHVKEYLANK